MKTLGKDLNDKKHDTMKIVNVKIQQFWVRTNKSMKINFFFCHSDESQFPSSKNKRQSSPFVKLQFIPYSCANC